MIYYAIVPHYKIPSKGPFKWEKLNVFCTTFNAGFGSPPTNLNLWFNKTKGCDVIAVGMQEADTAEWLEAIQEYYTAEEFTLVTLVTMWKVFCYYNFVILIDVALCICCIEVRKICDKY